MLGCTPQACKACSCPDTRPKKEPKGSSRDIDGLVGRESYKSEAKGPGATLLQPEDRTQPAISTTQGRRRLPFIGDIDIRLVHQLPGKPVARAGGNHGGSY